MPKLEKNLLVITMSLAFCSSFIVYLSIFNSPFPTQRSEIKMEMTDNTFRQPASNVDNSLSNQSQLKVNSEVNSKGLNMSTFDLNCLRENKSWDLNRAPKMLQIKGRLCGEGQFSKIEIINRSNGSRAVIFELKGKKFLSDYLSLSPGYNQLVLEAESSSGERFVNNFKVNVAEVLTK